MYCSHEMKYYNCIPMAFLMKPLKIFDLLIKPTIDPDDNIGSVSYIKLCLAFPCIFLEQNCNIENLFI